MANDYIGKYSGVQIDTLLGKVDEGIYTRSETDEKLAEKADIAEVSTMIGESVARIVADAPEDFDTLREMSDWIAAHEESAAAMNSSIRKNTSDITALKETAEGYRNGYIYLTSGTEKRIALAPSSAYIVFITFSSKIGMYFINTTTSGFYLKTIVDQLETVSFERNGLEILFTSTDSITLFARKLN